MVVEGWGAIAKILHILKVFLYQVSYSTGIASSHAKMNLSILEYRQWILEIELKN